MRTLKTCTWRLTKNGFWQTGCGHQKTRCIDDICDKCGGFVEIEQKSVKAEKR